MLEAGEDPLYVARRIIRIAGEDIGLADPGALLQAVAAHDAVQKMGMPEANVCLAQAAVYCALAQKSVAVYSAYKLAVEAVQRQAAPPVPLHLRNAPTKLMNNLGYGQGYIYPPDGTPIPPGYSYLPAGMESSVFYNP